LPERDGVGDLAQRITVARQQKAAGLPVTGET
jgi:hypothetical protein